MIPYSLSYIKEGTQYGIFYILQITEIFLVADFILLKSNIGKWKFEAKEN